MKTFQEFMSEDLKYVHMSGDEFYNHIRNHQAQNRDIHKNLKYLDSREMEKEHHINSIDKNGKVVGNCALQQNPYDENEIWLKHVTVHPKHRSKGIATSLLDKAFEHAKRLNKKLVMSSYSEEGEKYLPGVVEKLKKKHGVE